jgi:hypothetical protein
VPNGWPWVLPRVDTSTSGWLHNGPGMCVDLVWIWCGFGPAYTQSTFKSIGIALRFLIPPSRVCHYFCTFSLIPSFSCPPPPRTQPYPPHIPIPIPGHYVTTSLLCSSASRVFLCAILATSLTVSHRVNRQHKSLEQPASIVTRSSSQRMPRACGRGQRVHGPNQPACAQIRPLARSLG